ncbi:hypothetical protein AgCh_034408 [Apium graveolens]
MPIGLFHVRRRQPWADPKTVKKHIDAKLNSLLGERTASDCETIKEKPSKVEVHTEVVSSDETVLRASTESKFHVLVVDDNIILRKLIERLLKTSSFQVTTVDFGSKALEFLGLHEDDEQISPNKAFTSPINQQEMAVNHIITDYCMPGMTCYDLLKKIKESSFRDIPVVIIVSLDV